MLRREDRQRAEHAGSSVTADDGDRDDHDRRQRRRLLERDHRVRQAIVGVQLRRPRRRPRRPTSATRCPAGSTPSTRRSSSARRPRRVIVLGYPRLFMGEDCNAGTWFSGDDMTRLNQTADLLRDVTRTRATAYGFIVQGRDPAVHRARGLLVDRVAQRALQPDRRELPPEPQRAQSPATRRSCGR